MTLSCQFWRTFKRAMRSRDGSTAVELGFFIPLLAGMLLPLVDLGMGAYNQMQLQSAVQAAAGSALMNGFNATNIQAVVNANGGSLSHLTVATPTQQCGCSTTSNTVDYSTTQTPPSCSACPHGETSKPGVYVTVSATSTYTPLFTSPVVLPLFDLNVISGAVSLSAQSTVRIQ